MGTDMRKLIIALLILVLPSLSWAGSQQIRQVVGMAKVQGGGGGISDDFSADTSANYTAIKNGISISGGVLHGSTNWVENYAYHETSIGSDNHYVQGDIVVAAWENGSAVGLRCNGTTGYLVRLQTDNKFVLYKFNGTTLELVSTINLLASVTDATAYTVKITVSGSTFHFYIDMTGDDDFLDTNEDVGTYSDSTYSTGQYIVVGSLRGSGTDFVLDNLSAGAL